MLDVHLWGRATRISPEAPVMVVEEERTSYAAGGASNVAANLVSLGARASIAAVVGADPMAQQLREQLLSLGVDPEGLIADPGRPTTTKTRIIAHNQQIVRVDREASHRIPPAVEGALAAHVRQSLARADALILSDYSKGVMTAELVAEAAQTARAMGRPVLCNAKPANIGCFRDVDLLTVNQSEAEAVTGETIADVRSLRAAGERLLELSGGRGVFITRGGQGIALFGPDGAFDQVAGITEEVYDVAGAGDSVIAAAALALLAGATLGEAATLANYAGNAKVRKVGVVPVTRDEVRDIWELNEARGGRGAERRARRTVGSGPSARCQGSEESNGVDGDRLPAGEPRSLRYRPPTGRRPPSADHRPDRSSER
jgi:D-beta-D-heptose 7-phosphate kinase/D-beta-D-heptose 1-phosphate adenosyltransferase